MSDNEMTDLSDIDSDTYGDANDSMDEDDVDFGDSGSEVDSVGSLSDSGFSPAGVAPTGTGSLSSTPTDGNNPKPIASRALSKGKGRISSSSTHKHNSDSPYDVEYDVFSMPELLEQQRIAIDDVKEMLSIMESEAATLLRHFAWKKGKLIETYMDDPERTLERAGIHSSSSSQPRLKRVRGFICDVCFDNDDAKETLALSCDHRFCKECYSHYVSSKIINEGESRRIQCMGSKCNVIIDEQTVQLLVPPDVFSKYKQLLNRTYVDDSSTLRWCPAPNCAYAVYCSVPSHAFLHTIPTVHCRCGNVFCFGCGEQDHRPCVCPVVRMWNKKCADDSETSNWISANTKECTKCHSTIEKNGGCNHMTCKKCAWEFCWVCMGPWSEHGTSWYNCARYEEKGDTSKDAQSKSRASLERYLHYYNRFANHEQSIKLEAEIFARAEKKMDAMQVTSGLSWIECQFLAKAVETLGKCRTVLKWTYAMAFYLSKNNETEMFEDRQEDLERAVEALAEMVEKPLDEDRVAEMRQQTTDKTVYVAQRCKILLEDTLKGYDEDRWQFSEPLHM